MQAVFRRVGEQEAWGDHRVGHQPAVWRRAHHGANHSAISLYTGSESRVKMLQNPEFIDANVRILGKQAGGRWVKMGEFTRSIGSSSPISGRHSAITLRLPLPFPLYLFPNAYPSPLLFPLGCRKFANGSR